MAREEQTETEEEQNERKKKNMIEKGMENLKIQVAYYPSVPCSLYY